MVNYWVKCWNGKNYQAIAGIDENRRPVFVGNLIHGLVLWGLGRGEMDSKQAEMQAKYPHIRFKLVEVK